MNVAERFGLRSSLSAIKHLRDSSIALKPFFIPFFVSFSMIGLSVTEKVILVPISKFLLAIALSTIA
jgi:hypothetical protein